MLVGAPRQTAPPLRLIYSTTSKSSDDFTCNDRWKVVNRQRDACFCSRGEYLHMWLTVAALGLLCVVGLSVSMQVCYITTAALWRYHMCMETAPYCAVCSLCVFGLHSLLETEMMMEAFLFLSAGHFAKVTSCQSCTLVFLHSLFILRSFVCVVQVHKSKSHQFRHKEEEC